MAEPRRVTVIGAGYVGLATAIGLAIRGHRVELVEVRADRLDSLRSGKLPIHEPGMDEAFARREVGSRIHVESELVDDSPDVILICVGTPVLDGGRSDLTQVEGALRSILPLLEGGVPLIIRSTLPPGSTDKIDRWVHGAQSRVFASPEFLRQGKALEDFLHPSRVVVGTFPDADPKDLALVTELLHFDDAPLLVVTAEEAEIIKNGANAFLALKLSFANELAALCEELGADVLPVIEGIGLDDRIGAKYMQPSFGFGGSCLPKELRALGNVGRDLGLEMHVVSAAADANEALQRRFARRVLRSLPSDCRRVALLGLAFKADTDDVRYSPALRVAQLLLDRGVEVVGYDPSAGANAAQALPLLELAPSAEAALAGAGVAVIATEWPQFREIDWAAVGETMAARTVIDGRRLLDAQRMRSLGYRFEMIGAARRAVEMERIRGEDGVHSRGSDGA
jgi:UDPglucose 6-dehydrogenase